jgi:hypothetical protein
MKAYIEQLPDGVDPALETKNSFSFYSALALYLNPV